MNFKTKQQYRTQARKQRKNLDISLISIEICKQIKNLDIYKKAKKIAGFYSFGNETDIRQLYQDFSKQWFLPKIVNDETMIFYQYKSFSNMVKNKFEIYEPASGIELSAEEPDIIIVPALMTDKKGHRLGYGKGYYDRFLKKLPEECVKIVPIPEVLMIEELPYDEFDVPVDMAITQNKVYNFIHE